MRIDFYFFIKKYIENTRVFLRDLQIKVYHKFFPASIKSIISLYHLNIILIFTFVIALCSHVLLSSGLDEDGSFDLSRLIFEDRIIYHEVSRLFFNVFHQFPAWLFIKFSTSNNLFILTKIYSFGLIYVHIFSFLGCYLILPKTHKKLIFFPLFAFITGPLTVLGISVSVAFSVFSYIWFTAFVIYYSNLSLKLHRIIFFIAPLPLILSHEMISYMAWPLIALCILKEKNENNLFNKFIIKFMVGFFLLLSIINFIFIFGNNEHIINYLRFKESVLNLKFLFSNDNINLIILTALLLISSLLLQCFSNKIKNKFQFALFIYFVVVLFAVIFIPFSWYYQFLFVGNYDSRVWPPVFSLPLNLLIWWFYKNKILNFKHFKVFILSCFIVCITFTIYTVKSDLQFYKHQKQFSEQLQKCQGVLSWPVVKKSFKTIKNYEKLEHHSWKITASSLIYPRFQNIKAVLLNTNCMNVCRKEGKPDCKSFCSYVSFNIPSSLLDGSFNSRFFNFKPLIENISSKSLSVCDKNL